MFEENERKWNYLPRIIFLKFRYKTIYFHWNNKEDKIITIKKAFVW